MMTLAVQQALAMLRRYDTGPVSLDGYISPAMWRAWRQQVPGPVGKRGRRLRGLIARCDRAFARVADMLDEPPGRVPLSRLEDDLAAYARRRATELRIAERVEQAALTVPLLLPRVRQALITKAADMRACRQVADIEQVGDGMQTIKRWTHHCGDARLCPDESREEVQRLAVKWAGSDESVGQLIEWQQENSRRRRLQKWVLTVPNVAPGELRDGMQAIFARIKTILFSQPAYCSLKASTSHKNVGCVNTRDRSQTLFRAARHREFPAIKGAVAVLEAPLSARGDWNVHVNVIVGIEGDIDFAAVRAAWGFQCDFPKAGEPPLPTRPEALHAKLLEVIKYAAQHTGTKSANKKAKGKTNAPPLVEWPLPLLVEWITAHHRFRRTRTYGAFFGQKWQRPSYGDAHLRLVGVARFDSRTMLYRVD